MIVQILVTLAVMGKIAMYQSQRSTQEHYKGSNEYWGVSNHPTLDSVFNSFIQAPAREKVKIQHHCPLWGNSLLII